MQKLSILLIVLLTFSTSCGEGYRLRKGEATSGQGISAFWANATIYFLLTDRFHNGRSDNDRTLGRKKDGALLRNFEGGDVAGIIQKLEEGYFDELGVTAIWLTPVFEQIHGSTDEGTGQTYGYHGYWTKDWTALDPNFGTEEELAELVAKAHARGIRILLDAVVNHTGPVTAQDPVWPASWVRTDPTCTYQGYETTVNCTLVDNLPDIRTDATASVSLPPQLLEKWEAEGRLDQEIEALDSAFGASGMPRLPHQYIIAWLARWVRKYGIDGFRVDTAKHTDPHIWSALRSRCQAALDAWRQAHPVAVIHRDPFYMTGEVYGYGISGQRNYNYGDTLVDFFDHGFSSLINFEFKYDAASDYDFIFNKYDSLLNTPEMQSVSVVNYLTSHDDGQPFDMERQRVREAANKLLLAPGAAQIYYGDEIGRSLQVDGANGDANLRSLMSWDLDETQAAHRMHWAKLGKFRKEYPAVGTGSHRTLQVQPYLCSRILPGKKKASVIIGLDWPAGLKLVPVSDMFKNGTRIRDHYSGKEAVVKGGQVVIDSPFDTMLLSAV